jgi:two-component system, NtrC family, nitrogen regulation response regulator GlnG
VRVIAATHQDLNALVAEGRFRADLLHRLDVVRLPLPPLRARRDDIPRLAERFLRAAALKFEAPAKRFAPAAMQRLLAHDWPGNVRELENLCWRLAALAPGDSIAPTDLDDVFVANASNPPSPSSAWETALGDWARGRLDAGDRDLHAEARARFDQVLFDAALAHTGGHRSEAAAKLGLGRNTLTRKLGPRRAPRRPA